jgi:hypothetical protein
MLLNLNAVPVGWSVKGGSMSSVLEAMFQAQEADQVLLEFQCWALQFQEEEEGEDLDPEVEALILKELMKG